MSRRSGWLSPESLGRHGQIDALQLVDEAAADSCRPIR
jgi:hypothetical protein